MTDRYERKAYERIWNALQKIKAEIILTGGNDVSISLWFLNGIDKGYLENRKVLDLFVYKEKVIKIMDAPEESLFKTIAKNPETKIKIKVNKAKFDKYFDKIESIYKDNAEEYQESQKPPLKEILDPNEIVYEINYSQDRVIRINNFKLFRPTSFKENHIVFEYLFKNPNKPIKIDQIEKFEKTKIKKDINSIVYSLGFKGQLREVFFNVNKNTIEFRNPITRDMLDNLGIKWLELNEKVKKIKNDKTQ